MPKVEFKRVETDEEVENINIKDGQLIYSKTGKTFMDYGNERIPTGSGGSSGGPSACSSSKGPHPRGTRRHGSGSPAPPCPHSRLT